MRKITYLCLLLGVICSSLIAQEQVSYEQAFPNLTFEFPVEIQNANDSSDRLFIVEQSGRIKVFQNDPNTSQQQVFLDLTNEVSFSSGQEIGLLGLAFHPNFSENRYLFVYYTRQSGVPNVGVEIVIARYEVNSTDINKVDTSSKLEILSFDKNQNHSNHNGGKIGFGPDGYLYASFGDGGGGGDPNKNAQNLENPFGSILRIDVDLDGNNPLESNPDAPNGNYEIPSDNPLVGKAGMDELYAWGIRNTWKFSFDKTTGSMWGADVGQGEYEEINLIQKGGNYGWNRYEANSSYNGSTNLVTTPDIKPIFQYDHGNGDVSITGGYVYRGSNNNQDLQGKYIYADYVSGRVWALDYNSFNGTVSSKLLFRTNGEYVSSFGLDESGEMYFSGYGTSAKIFKIIGGNESTDPVTNLIDGIGTWKDLENGSNGNIECVVSYGDNIYVAGSFTNVGFISANNIAVYNKNEGWQSLSNGSNGIVNAIAVASDGTVYAGGEFTSIGGVEANNIAVWNGTNWSAMNEGTDGPIAEIGIDSSDNIYIGGAFETAGGITVHNIAKWNDGWVALTDTSTSDVGTNNEIRAMAFDANDLLIVGGNFDSAGGNTANRIATWNGSNWGTLGVGTSGFVQAILVDSDYIYTGGNFVLAGNKTVNRIARWNKESSTWEAIGNGVSGSLNALATDDSYIYLAGNFETVSDTLNDNKVVNNIARWSATSGFQALGPDKNVGSDNEVNSISFSDNKNDLYTAGSFNKTGNINSSRIAVWSENFDCSDVRIIMEYALNNGDWISGDTKVTIDQGTLLSVRMSENGQEYSIIGPDGNSASGPQDLGAVKPSQSGIYTITQTDGCSSDFEIVVIGNNEVCEDGSIVPQYKIDGLWFSGQKDVSVQLGSEVVLSMLPDGIDLQITLPTGEIVGDDYNLGVVTTASSGTYILTSATGCTTEINLSVTEGLQNCDENLITEYRINGEWSSGEDSITIDEGSEIIFSMLPNGVPLAVTLPDGTIVKDNHKITDFSSAQAGNYLLTTANGCLKNLNVAVVNGCTDESIIPEYRLDGIWSSGENEIVVNEGSDVMLSMLPNNVGLTIMRPDGTIVADDYAMNSIQKNQEGVYTILSEEGCSETINVLVQDQINCSPDSIIPEYSIDGVWESGQNFINVNEGSDLLLSMLPNNVGLTIILPDGREVPDDYELLNVGQSHSGVYTLISEEGCKATLAIDVLRLGSSKTLGFEEFRVEYLSTGYGSDQIGISTYPNPTIDEVSINLQSVLGKSLEVLVTNLQQQVLLNESLDKGHAETINLDFTNFTQGIYILSLTTEDGKVISRKIVKNR